MKFKIDSSAFTTALNDVSKAVATKTTIPELTCVLVTAREDEVILSSYDLNLAIVETVKTPVEEEGSVLLEAKTLIQIANTFDDQIFVETGSNDTVTIYSNTSHYKLLSMNVNNFPEIPNISEDVSFEINQGKFAEAVKQTIFAASKDDTKGVHCGVKFEITNNNLKMVALDGFRFAINNIDTAYFADSASFVCPAKTLNDVSAIAREDNGTIIVRKNSSHCEFEFGDCRVITSLLTGNYLDYNKAIPTSEKFYVDVDKNALLKTVKNTAVVINDRSRSPLKLSFTKEKGLTISAESTTGVARNEFNVDYVSDDTFEIGINNKYLEEALKSCNTDIVRIHFVAPNSPIWITPTNSDNFTHLILAVRL